MRYLFWVFIFLIPSQLGKHFWPEWSLVEGVRVDYLSPTVYATDILLFLLVALILINHKSYIRNHIGGIPLLFILFMISYILFMILRSPRPWLAGYWLARYLEIPLVAFLTMEAERTRGMRRNRWTGRDIPIALGIAVLWSVGLGVVQMVLGRTTGWFWWLGERNFNLATPGIATMTVLGREILRPYATFGHPNALAGFLAVGVMILIGKKEEGRRKKVIREQWEIIAICVGVLGVILTGSRGAMAGMVVGCGLWVACLPARQVGRGMRKLGILGILGGLGLLGILGNLGSAVKFAGEAGGERLILAEAAGRMWRENWLIGAGPGQFLARLPEFLPAGFYKIQPVHNIFLLALAEFGILGIGIMVITIIKIIKSAVGAKGAGLKWAPVLAVIFVTGMVDHYWLTAQQNRLLLGVILGLMISVLGRRSICGSGLRLRSKWQYPDGKKAQGGQSGVRPE